MENASKALLIAGGILLVMLIIGLVLFSWQRFSDYYKNKDELAEIEDIAKFNLQFSNYENREVHGYELVSLANKIADYNFRYSDAEGAKNDKKYNRITMQINLKDGAQNFTFRDKNNLLFKYNLYTNDGITNIIESATEIENYYQGKELATKLAKSIDALVLSEDQIAMDESQRGMTRVQSEQFALEKYNSITKNNKYTDFKSTAGNDLKDYKAMCIELQGSGSNVMEYYEYYQFKKAIFKCTSIKYDGDDASDVGNTGRVKSISFEYEKLE